MRYISQKLTYDCVPVGIFNAMRYFGRNASCKYLNRLRRLCKTNKSEKGTQFQDICKVVNQKFEVVRSFSFDVGKDIRRDNELCFMLDRLKHKPALAGFPAISGFNHFVFIEKYLPGQDKLVVVGWRCKRRRVPASVLRNVNYIFFIKGIK